MTNARLIRNTNVCGPLVFSPVNDPHRQLGLSRRPRRKNTSAIGGGNLHTLIAANAGTDPIGSILLLTKEHRWQLQRCLDIATLSCATVARDDCWDCKKAPILQWLRLCAGECATPTSACLDWREELGRQRPLVTPCARCDGFAIQAGCVIVTWDFEAKQRARCYSWLNRPSTPRRFGRFETAGAAPEISGWMCIWPRRTRPLITLSPCAIGCAMRSAGSRPPSWCTATAQLQLSMRRRFSSCRPSTCRSTRSILGSMRACCRPSGKPCGT